MTFKIFYNTEGGGAETPAPNEFETLAQEIETELNPKDEEGNDLIPDETPDEEEVREVNASPYDELFQSPEQAKEIIQQAQNFNLLANTIIGGSSEELLSELSQNEDKDAVARFATNFLPALNKVNPELYDRVAAPVLTSVLKAALRDSDIHSNQNLKAAVVLLTKYVFGKAEIPDIRPVDIKRFKNAAEKESKEEKPDNVMVSFQKNTIEEMFSASKARISEKLAARFPNEIVREGVTDKVFARVGAELQKDAQHIERMNTLWRRAKSEGFSISSQKRIVDAYTKAMYAKLPLALKSVSVPNKSAGKQKEPGQTSSSGRPTKDAKNIDWTKTTTRDYLDGKITYKE